MTAIIVRLLLSMIVMLGAPVLYLIACVVLFESRVYHYSHNEIVFLWATAISGGYLVAAWWLVWRGMVRWTASRLAWTGAALVGAVLIGAGAGAVFERVTNEEEIAIIIGGMVGALLWLAASTLAWRETRTEREQRQINLGVHALPCPACGYNLAGLHGSTCPECGAKYTLDQLFAAVVESKQDMDG